MGLDGKGRDFPRGWWNQKAAKRLLDLWMAVLVHAVQHYYLY